MKTALYVAVVTRAWSAKEHEWERTKQLITDGAQTLADCQTRAGMADAKVKETEALRPEAEQCQKIVDKVREEEPRYKEREMLQHELGQIQLQLAAQEQQEVELGTAEQTLQKRIGELQEQQAMWKEEPQQLAQAQAAHDKLLDSQKKTESIAKNLIPAWRRKQQELEEAQSEYRKKQDAYESAKEAFTHADRLYRANLVGILASDLAEGEPCPVCGATPVNAAISTFRISSFTTVTLSYSASVSARIGSRFLSISTANTSPAASAKYCVIVPIPGPISSTTSSFVISAARMIFSITCPSIRKF